jgi:four helix bundle protein
MMFEDLEAWQQARHLVNEIYSLTRENSSLSKDFGLTDQVQRAAVSIMSNVAEGFERTHLPEKIQFYNIARGSTGEVRSLLYVISDNYPRSAPVAERVRSTAISVGKVVSGPFAVDRGTERQTPTSTVASARPNLLSASLYLPMTR